MSQTTKTVSQMLNSLFPKSQEALSQKLTAEQFNEFQTEINELNSRLDAQTEGNVKLKADYDAEKLKVTTLETEVATLKTKVTTLEPLQVDNLKLKNENEQLTTWKQNHHKAVSGAAPDADASLGSDKPQFAEGSVMAAAMQMVGTKKKAAK